MVELGLLSVADGKMTGAPDLQVGLNHVYPVVVELKTARGETRGVGLNEALDVVKGAAVVARDHLAKVTLANSGLDLTVRFQPRNVRNLALVEACELAFAAVLVANGEASKEAFLDWLAQPGLIDTSSLTRSVGAPGV